MISPTPVGHGVDHLISWESLRKEQQALLDAAHYDDPVYTEGVHDGLMLAINASNNPAHNRPVAITPPGVSGQTGSLSPVDQAVLNIRLWLVQANRYTASTIELDEVTRREISVAVEAVAAAMIGDRGSE